MPKTKTTLFSPLGGSKIYLEDTVNNTEILTTVLNYFDKTDFKHRSPKGTPREQRFFYVKTIIDGNISYIKLLNSICHNECLSDDKRYRFSGKTTKGNIIKNSNDTIKEIQKKKYSSDSSSRIFVSPKYLPKIKELK